MTEIFKLLKIKRNTFKVTAIFVVVTVLFLLLFRSTFNIKQLLHDIIKSDFNQLNCRKRRIKSNTFQVTAFAIVVAAVVGASVVV